MKRISFVPTCALMFTAAFISVNAYSATFNVTDVSGFQDALTTAQSNGEDDTINVAAGTYNVTSSLTYATSENFGLTIVGAGSTTTILDGGNSVQIMRITSEVTSGDISISGLRFEHGRVNDLAAFGAGLYVLGPSDGGISVDQCIATNCTAIRNTAGAWLGTQNGDITVTNSSFTHNECDDGTSDDGCGLYLYFDGDSATGNATVRNNDISNNTLNTNPTPVGNCDGAGMMIYHLGTSGTAPTITVENNTINDNLTYEGASGASFHILHQQAVFIMTGNTFSGNVAGPLPSGVPIQIFGGGAHVYLDGGDVTITNNQFLNNRNLDPYGEGAGLCLDNLPTGTIQVSGNVFAGNQCSGLGGGALINPGDGVTSANIAGNLFVNNQAGLTEGSAGGLSVSAGCNVSLDNNTFYNNTAADGGGLTFYSESTSHVATLNNEIYWGNTPSSIVAFGTGPIQATYSNIDGGTGQSYFGTGCIDTDPLFFDAANPPGADGIYANEDDGLHLTSSSPSVNTGNTSDVPSFLTTDLAGAERIQDGTVDMGAYEGVAGAVTPYLRLTVSPSTIAAGETASGTVTRGGGDNTDALTVTLSSSNTAVATVPSTMTIEAGQSSGIFTVTGGTESGSSTITGSADGYRSGTATVTVGSGPAEDRSVSLGSVFSVLPDDLTDFSGDEFPRKPKVVANYEDPVRARDKRSPFKVYYDRDNPESVDCEWTKKVALYNKRDIGREETTEEFIAGLSGGVIPSLELPIQVTAVDDNGERGTYDYSGTVNLVPPQITTVTDEDGNVITSAGAGETVVLTGTYFGTKKPKVWLEYRDDNNRVKCKKCRVLTGDDYQPYEDHNGKASFMNIETGVSVVYFQLPPRFPNGWDFEAEHNIVLDNKIGRATVDFSTTE